MTALKNIKIFGLRAKIQSAVGTPATNAATDAILLAENPVLKRSYAHDGSRSSSSPATMGNIPRVAPSGLVGELPFKIEPRGFGSAYSASNLPLGHVLLRACGLDAAVTTTGGLEKWVYTPSAGPTGFAIASVDLYSRGQLWPMTDVYGDFTLGANGPSVPEFAGTLKGLLGATTDVALPTMTYGAPKDLLPPKAISMALTWNSIALPKPKSWSLKFGRTINPRMDQNGAGHGGFAIGARAPMLEVTIENVALATLDAYGVTDAATSGAWSMVIGSTQYNRWKLSGPAAQVMPSMTDETEDPTATIKMTFQLNPSALGLNDEFTLTFD